MDLLQVSHSITLEHMSLFLSTVRLAFPRFLRFSLPQKSAELPKHSAELNVPRGYEYKLASFKIWHV